MPFVDNANNDMRKPLKSIAEKIKKKFNPQEVILFGSYAYGTPKKGSDVDLLVVMNTAISLKEQAFLIRKEIKELIPIDVIVRTPEQIKERIKLGDFFVKRIIRDGISL